MNKKIEFYLAVAGLLLITSGCASQKTAAPYIDNSAPSSFSVSQTPIPTKTPIQTPNPTSTSTEPANTASSTPSNLPPTPAIITPPAAETIQINIQNFSFNPAEITVPLGSTIVWKNNDAIAHQIASAAFNSQLLNQGDSFSQKFTTPGTFDYHCSIHSSMTGKIIVK
jgi:plastocyanin